MLGKLRCNRESFKLLCVFLESFNSFSGYVGGDGIRCGVWRRVALCCTI